MQVLTFMPDAMLLMSLAHLAPWYQPFKAQPRPRVDTVLALQRSGVSRVRVMAEQRRVLRTHGAKARQFQRRKSEANRRAAHLRKNGKLLWSDVVDMRAHDPGRPRKPYVQAVRRTLAASGVHVSESLIYEILRGELWQAPY